MDIDSGVCFIFCIYLKRLLISLLIMQKYPENAIRIPQNDNNIRALNLSNSAAIVIYEVLRQQSFPNLARVHKYEFDKLK